MALLNGVLDELILNVVSEKEETDLDALMNKVLAVIRSQSTLDCSYIVITKIHAFLGALMMNKSLTFNMFSCPMFITRVSDSILRLFPRTMTTCTTRLCSAFWSI